MKKSSPESRILTALFLGPPVLVALAVFGPWELGWLPQAEGPYGQRYDPPIVLPEILQETPTGSPPSVEWVRVRWSLIYARVSGCDEPCLEWLELLRQVRLALAEDRELVQRVYLYGGSMDALDAETVLTTGLVMRRIDGPAGTELRQALGEDRLDDGHIYIADPGGNLVLSYSLDVEHQGIITDLKRLLAISRIV